jgi:hypothetical protein
MTLSDNSKSNAYACIFCGRSIEPGPLDPCAINLVACIDRPRGNQKDQTFYCHISCIQALSSSPQNFYITDSDFPTIGEIEGVH